MAGAGSGPYRRSQLTDDAIREAIVSDLRGREWSLTVTRCLDEYCFLAHPGFPDGVFLGLFLVAAHGERPGPGDRVTAIVGVRRDRKRNQWGYAVERVLAVERAVARAPIPAAKPAPRPAAAPAGASDRSARATPGPHGASARRRRPRRKRVAAERGATTATVPRPAVPFALSGPTLSIYIDEVEVGKGHGAIAGIAWDGAGMDVKALRRLGVHRKDPGPLSLLLGCPRAFPFIIPVAGDDAAAERYQGMVRTAIQVLLGWLLPLPSRRTRVVVHLEQYGGFLDGADHTAFFQGALDEARIDFPDRFANWDLDSVTWRAKSFEYIQWGDLLGYWYLTQVVRQQAFGPTDCRSLHGFLPIQTEDYRRLRRVALLRDTRGVADVLDFLRDLAATQLATLVVDQVRPLFAADERLRVSLLDELDRRYRFSDRDLRRLGAELAAVRMVVGPLAADAPVRVRLLTTALDLQDANHAGDPERATGFRDLYQRLRPDGLRLDRDLVAHIDANLAVSYSDAFNFERATEALRWMLDDPHFSALTPAAQARHQSSLGQQAAFRERFEEAETHFTAALDLFVSDPGLSAPERDRQIDQTQVYRAINALDGGLAHATDAFRAALGEDPVTAASRLATHASASGQYHHHLLVRSCALDEGFAAVRAAYLSGHASWAEPLPQHPWELICCYRGLILWNAEFSDGEAQRWFMRGVEIAAADGHGAVLRLIGAAIAVTGLACVRDRVFEQAAIGQLEGLEAQGRYKEPRATLRTILAQAKASASSTDKHHVRDLAIAAMRVLPFNYR